jgi:hypothetical protein
MGSGLGAVCGEEREFNFFEALMYYFANNTALNQAQTQSLRVLKSPFEKGGFRGISGC